MPLPHFGHSTTYISNDGLITNALSKKYEDLKSTDNCIIIDKENKYFGDSVFLHDYVKSLDGYYYSNGYLYQIFEDLTFDRIKLDTVLYKYPHNRKYRLLKVSQKTKEYLISEKGNNWYKSKHGDKIKYCDELDYLKAFKPVTNLHDDRMVFYKYYYSDNRIWMSSSFAFFEKDNYFEKRSPHLSFDKHQLIRHYVEKSGEFYKIIKSIEIEGTDEEIKYKLNKLLLNDKLKRILK